jgi:hypothetical protein
MNQSLIEQSGITWPYPSGEWLHPVIELPDSIYNQNIIFEIDYSGTTGYYFLIDNFSFYKALDNDIGFYEILPFFGNQNYVNTWYSNIPIMQVQSLVKSKVFVMDYCENTQTGIVTTMNIYHNGNCEYSDSIDYFVNYNSDSLSEINKFDTMIINSNYLPYQLGEYNIVYNVSQDQTDEDLSDNTDTITFNITNNKYSSYNIIDSKFSLSDYSTGESGDFAGNIFYFKSPTSVDSIRCYIADGTSPNTYLTAKIYKYIDYLDTYEIVGASNNITIYSSNIGSYIDIPFSTPVSIDSNSYYAIGISTYWSGNDKVYISSEKLIDGFPFNPRTSVIYTDSSWYYIDEFSAIEVYLTPVQNTQIVATANYGASNLFADSSVIISLYKSDNNVVSLTQEPQVMFNNSVSFNYLFDGDYYIKSQVIDTSSYPNVFPVYFYDAAIIDSATILSLTQGDSIFVTINHPITSISPGTNNIQGTVYQTTKSGVSVTDQIAVLQDAQSGEILNVALLTDNNNNYAFNNITDNSNFKIFISSFIYPNWIPAEISTTTGNTYTIDFICLNDSVYPTTFSNIENNEINKVDFKLYPNPASNLIKLENIPDNSTIKIFNTTGQLILSDKRSSKSVIDISDLKSGTYIIVVSDKNNIGTATFVKN